MAQTHAERLEEMREKLKDIACFDDRYPPTEVNVLAQAILLLMEAMEDRHVQDLVTFDPIDMAALGPEILGQGVYDALHPEAMEGKKGI